MAAQIRSTLKVILPKMRQRLIDANAIGQDCVYLAARDETPKFQGDQDVVIRPGAFTVENPITGTGGRVTTRITQRVTLTLRSRLSLDESDRDATWLTDATLGYLQFEDKVVDALHIWFPEDTTGNVLTDRPIRLLAGSGAMKGPMRGQPQEWGESQLDFEVVYIRDVDQTRAWT